MPRTGSWSGWTTPPSPGGPAVGGAGGRVALLSPARRPRLRSGPSPGGRARDAGRGLPAAAPASRSGDGPGNSGSAGGRGGVPAHPLAGPEALVAASHGAAVLVVGAHPAGRFAQLVTSVSHRAAAFATCPVAFVRQGQY
ncbi:MAG: universal stress protein, partial [Oryzihumus sp.]